MIPYKKFIKSREIRLKILRILRWIPDSWMIQLQYRMKTGRGLNLKNPKRFSEKLQWCKLNYRTTLHTRCADKFTVRGYVEEKGLGYILNELYAVYDRAEEVDFDALPGSFALKYSGGCGLNYLVTDKSKEDWEALRDMMAHWFEHDSYAYGREWQYKNSAPRILVEQLLPCNKENDLPDYKFFCFNGKVYCLYAIIDHSGNLDDRKIGVFDREFNQMPCSENDHALIMTKLEKPICFDEMVRIAEVLAKDFPHVRVDLYNVNGSVVFGEMTFCTASGYVRYTPDEFDFILGEQFELPEKLIEDG